MTRQPAGAAYVKPDGRALIFYNNAALEKKSRLNCRPNARGHNSKVGKCFVYFYIRNVVIGTEIVSHSSVISKYQSRICEARDESQDFGLVEEEEDILENLIFCRRR